MSIVSRRNDFVRKAVCFWVDVILTVCALRIKSRYIEGIHKRELTEERDESIMEDSVS